MTGGGHGQGGNWVEGENLELIENDERLPWLEAVGEDDDATSFSTSRVVLLGTLSLLLVAILVGGIWYALAQVSDEPPADGSLITAPEGPYKTRPDDPGGKTYAGTGDTSFAVGEGQSREGQLAEKPSGIEIAGSAPSSIGQEGEDTSETPKTGGVAVQVGAFPRREDAEEAWGKLLRQTEALTGVRYRVVAAQIDIGTVYRLQAIAADRASARRLCSALKADGLPCFVK